jgi:glycosyltransferase involved in cell wall biosynthesis
VKVLVFAHRLELGGTQTNAIELAAAVRDRHGWDVVLVAEPGPAQALAEEKGLRLVAAPAAAGHPSLKVARALRAVVRAEKPDLIHTWDWPQCFDAYYGEHLIHGVPLLCTIMGMTTLGFIPRGVPTTYGTRALADEARQGRSGSVDLLEPPVDVDRNAPGTLSSADTAEFRERFGIDDSRRTVAVVSRLVEWLKLESLLRGIGAVDLLAKDTPVRLLVVGEGTARDRVAALANEVNDRHGAEVVVLTGGLVDPRPAYEVADVMFGMGGSALRSMAFAKPLIVFGERGFSRTLDRSSADWFLRHGWYGLGEGDTDPAPVAEQLRPLLADAGLRADLGAFGRGLVVEHYGLEPAARGLAELYGRVAAGHRPVAGAAVEGARTAALLAGRRLPAPVRQQVRKLVSRRGPAEGGTT